MIRIAIVEDEKIWQETYREYLKRYVTETHEAIETDVYSDGMDFISDYAGGYDIILMDIAMPHMNGLDSARLLRKVDSNVCLLYITTLSQFAIKGYEVGALDFLVKPVGYELFKIKLEKAIAASNRSRKTSFSIAVQGGARKIPLSDILYIESNKHYLYFHTQKEELKMRGSLDDVKSFFCENGFAAVNRSVLVNLAYVDGYDTQTVTVAGENIPLSRIYKAEFLGKLAKFTGGSF